MTPNGERPESVQFFGKTIFSRRSARKARLDMPGSRSSSSLSTLPSMSVDHTFVDRLYGRKGSHRGTMSDSGSLDGTLRKNHISGPFNFQHLTHTRQEQLPDLNRASRMELLTEFSAIRASQAPAHGQLKGIRAEDIHFKNFSSEDLNASPGLTTDSETRPGTPRRTRNTLKKSISPDRPCRDLTHARSHENLHASPPPRPAHPSPLPPPPRTSSRTASMLWNPVDPIVTSLERPQTVNGFRRAAAFHLPITRSEELQDDVTVQAPAAPSRPIPDAESWPLVPGTFECSFQLADVPEEEENYAASRRSRVSSASVDLRSSRSVPNLMIRNSVVEHPVPNITRPRTPPERTDAIGIAISPDEPAIKLTHESWEDDIDYCYEHAAEANCDYEWDRCSAEGGPQEESPSSSDTATNLQRAISEPISSEASGVDLLPASDFGACRFRPSLLVPSAMDLPELSPMTSSSVDSPELHTPGLLRPAHFRSASRASSFRESQGFTLSPTLLIPTDFSAQMDEEDLYDELFSSLKDQDRDVSVRTFGPYPISPVEGTSSTSSYRSSGFSRASNGAASISKSDSNDSVVLLSRAASIALQHRSASSSSSLPDLVHSSVVRPKRDAQDLDPVQRPQPSEAAPAPDVLPAEPLRRKKSSGFRLGSVVDLDGVLSPVRETFGDFSAASSTVVLGPPPPVLPPLPPTHGRKISAPVTGTGLAGMENFKGRNRSMSVKSRASYGLFPQI